MCVGVKFSDGAMVHLYQSFGFEIAGRSFNPGTDIEYLSMTRVEQ
jgi:hypothetical protein